MTPSAALVVAPELFRRWEGATVPKKLYYRIGEACRAVDIQPYVLRYWETEFEALAPGKSKSGQRVYTEEELGVIRRIKELLYEEGYTIAGAKKRLAAELEEGRSFAAPEGEGELFEGGGDDVPVIAVEGPAADAEPSADLEARATVEANGAAGEGNAVAARDSAHGDETAEAAEAAASGSESEAAVAASHRGLPSWTEEEPSSPAPGVASAASATAPGASDRAEDPSAPAAPAVKSSGSRRRAGAARGRATAVVEAPAPAGSAVDSPLSERVETLEHGLRRVLAEVRQLRELLADPNADR